MKQILTIVALSPLLFFSCRNTATQNTDLKDSVVQTATDTAASLPVEEPSLEAVDSVSSDPVVLGQDDIGPENFDYTYEGTINGKIKVRINIFQYHRELKARAVYLSTKQIIDMEATYPSVGHFELTEKVNGKATGIWKIASGEEDIMSGTWNSPDGAKQMPISLSMSPIEFDNFLPATAVKTGYYTYKEINDDAETKTEFPITFSEELYIKNMSGNSIAFDLYIQGPPPGVHIGMLNATAYKAGNNYVYKNDEGCEITMAFSGDEVKLDQKGNDINCGFGANIGAFGTLKKSNP